MTTNRPSHFIWIVQLALMGIVAYGLIVAMAQENALGLVAAAVALGFLLQDARQG